MTKKVLFVTWDGPQVNYVESLFLPIFARLEKHGYKFHVFQYTWGGSDRRGKTRAACELLGVPYRSVTVLRKPSVSIGSLLTAVCSRFTLRRAIKEWSIDMVMPRAVLPSLAVLGISPSHCPSIVYDADGLEIDEKVDFLGLGAGSLSHRILRDVELRVLGRSQLVLGRSKKALEVYRSRAGSGARACYKEVINGRDESVFRVGSAEAALSTRRGLNIDPNCFLFIYVGSIGDQYHAEEMLEIFSRVRGRCGNANFLFVTSDKEALTPLIDDLDVDLKQAVHFVSGGAEEVASFIACADVGFALREKTFSMQAVAPLKVGEYLLCGKPVIASTEGIGDLASYFSNDCGYALNDFSESSLEGVVDWCLHICEKASFEHASQQRRAIGLAQFSIEASVSSYLEALDQL